MTTNSTQWTCKGTAGHETHGQSAVYDETGKDIAIVYDGDAHGDLIAAAPDLAEALRELNSLYDNAVFVWGKDDEETVVKWFQAARAALRKAGVE